MKIEVEIPDDWMIQQLQEDCEICFSSSLPEKMHLIREHDILNMISALKTCNAINMIIEYYGGVPVDLTKVKPFENNPKPLDEKQKKELADLLGELEKEG